MHTPYSQTDPPTETLRWWTKARARCHLWHGELVCRGYLHLFFLIYLACAAWCLGLQKERVSNNEHQYGLYHAYSGAVIQHNSASSHTLGTGIPAWRRSPGGQGVPAPPVGSAGYAAAVLSSGWHRSCADTNGATEEGPLPAKVGLVWGEGGGGIQSRGGMHPHGGGRGGGGSGGS